MSWSAAHKHFLRPVPRRNLDQGAHRDTRRGPHPVGSTKMAHGGRGRFFLDQGIPSHWPARFDGAKKLDGVKRHVLEDSAATLVAAVVTSGNAQDRAPFSKLLRRAKRIAPTIAHVRVGVDKGHTGSTIADAVTKAGVTVDAVSGPKPGRRFIV